MFLVSLDGSFILFSFWGNLIMVYHWLHSLLSAVWCRLWLAAYKKPHLESHTCEERFSSILQKNCFDQQVRIPGCLSTELKQAGWSLAPSWHLVLLQLFVVLVISSAFHLPSKDLGWITDTGKCQLVLIMVCLEPVAVIRTPNTSHSTHVRRCWVFT